MLYGSCETGKSQPVNQEMLLFNNCADLLLKMYRHEITETDPKCITEAYQYRREQGRFYNRKNKKIAVEIAIWIEEVERVSKTEDLDNVLEEVLEEIESLKNKLSDFKHFKPFKTRFSSN